MASADTVLWILFLISSIHATLSALPMEDNFPPRPKEGGVTTSYCAYQQSSPLTPCDESEVYTNPDIKCINGVLREACPAPEADKSIHCFVIWHYDNVSDTALSTVKGCFVDTVACLDRVSTCRIHVAKRPLLHCCCVGDMCNENSTFPGMEAGIVPTDPAPKMIPASPIPTPEDDTAAIIVYTLAPLFVLFVILVGCYLLYRKRKDSTFAELANGEVSLSRPPSTGPGMENEDADFVSQLTLCEVKAKGRFGAVWRAKLGQKDVAVKVFPLQDKQSWVAEQEIYRLPRMDHPDILHYIGVGKKGDNLQAEFWLISAYHEKGSLCDYLKAHTLTWPEAWRIAACVSRGLAHLHEEGGGKPAVAHRDFKSKNVLLKSDLSACIADFGLALVFVPGIGCGDTHGQVGTRRYMAPEVLDGAINFTKDAFLRIDMYACALVLWEIASRCSEGGVEAAGTYRLPLEEEVGAHPGLEEMQEAVVQRKLRPHIPHCWRQHPGLSVLCDTMEECWDHDAEARLSASCVLERVGCCRPPPPAAAPPAPAPTPPTHFPPTPDTTPLLIHELADRPTVIC